VILLLDEQLDSPDMRVARALDIIGASHDLSFRSLRTEAAGLKDPEIPAYCEREGIDALVSFNVRDWGAKDALYRALIEAGVSIIVLRPQAKKSLTVEQQLSVLSKHLRVIGGHLHEGGNVLVRVNESGCRKWTLEELRKEIAREGRLP
jgi:hypothetical protein